MEDPQAQAPFDDVSIATIEPYLTRLSLALVSPSSAHQLVAPTEPKSGHWFGSGNVLVVDSFAYLIGRYRDAGDSRFGVGRGRRGWCIEVRRCRLENSVLPKNIHEQEWEVVARLLKSECGGSVLSLEGSCLFMPPQGASPSPATPGVVHALISSEKRMDYPASVRKFQKPGTGIWTIDEYLVDLQQGSFALFRPNVIASNDPQYLHLKDPNVGCRSSNQLLIFFTSSSYLWSSAVSGFCFYGREDDKKYEFFQRGTTWDVAMVRVTCRFPVPKIGIFADLPSISIFFYDGSECVKPHGHTQSCGEESSAIESHLPDSWPKGSSCEEVSGIGWCYDGQFPRGFHRLSKLSPTFWSPSGSGCLRYIHVSEHGKTAIALYQMSVEDGSQPLFVNVVTEDEIRSLVQVADFQTTTAETQAAFDGE